MAKHPLDIDEEFVEWDTIVDCGQDVDEVEVIDGEIEEIGDTYPMTQFRTQFKLQFEALYAISVTIIEAIALATQRAEPIPSHTTPLSSLVKDGCWNS